MTKPPDFHLISQWAEAFLFDRDDCLFLGIPVETNDLMQIQNTGIVPHGISSRLRNPPERINLVN
ncbi:MAG: hypothetical protein WA110_02205 [Anaerolineaceae bacterium]